MKKIVILTALAAALLEGGCTVDVLTKGRSLSFDFSGTTVKVSANGARNSLELKPYLAANGGYAYSVLFANRRAGFIYVLLDASGRSSADARGPCAAGAEENLIWLKLDAALHIQDANSVLVDSCLDNIHGQQGYALSGNQLSMKYVRTSVGGEGANVASRQVESELKYDNDHPEAGLLVQTNEVK
jgi:hypothetical protein